MFKKIIIISVLLFVGISVILPAYAFAQGGDETAPNLQNLNASLVNVGKTGYQATTDYSSDSIYKIIGAVVTFCVSLVGVVVTIFIIYGGWLWMTASGNEDKVKEAQGIIKNSVIALVIIFAAWLLTQTVIGFFGGSQV
jgi:hypothetical protein